MIPQSISSKLTDLQVAELTIDGLAICCFNSAEKLWEVAYPRHQQHDLFIIIQELDATRRPVGSPVSHTVPAGVRSFTISLTDGTDTHNAVFPSGGPADANFRRTAPNNDPHDLGWIIDLAGAEPGHEFSRLLPRQESQRDVTLAQIRHSVFFTSRIGDDPVRLSPRNTDDPFGPGSRVLGHTNEAIGGVLLAAKAGEVRFESDPAGSLNIAPLPYDQTRRYAIRIINEDRQLGVMKGEFIKGDFHFFYDLIEVNGEQQELWAVPKPLALGSASNGDCDPVTISSPTLRTLIS